MHLGLLGCDFTAMDPPELVAQLRQLARWYQRAVADPAVVADPVVNAPERA